MNEHEEPIEPEDAFCFDDSEAELPSARSVALPGALEDVDSFGLDAAFDESPEVYGEALAAKIEFARAQEFRENELLVAGSSNRSALVFRLGQRLFGIDVLEIAEVFQAEQLMPIPVSPPCLLGIANQRGSVLCVVVLESVLGMNRRAPARRSEAKSAILVLRDTSLRVGFSIDSVLGISPLRGSGFHPDQSREGFIGTLDVHDDLVGQGSDASVDLIDFEHLERALRAISFSVGAA